MKTSSPKTLEDFPKFVVIALRRGPTADEGSTFFEVEGRLDQHVRTDGPQWFWLLFGKRGSLCASVQSLDKVTGAAVLTFEAAKEPDIVGHTLVYLSPYWQAYNVWMVVDQDWGWEKKKFLGMDAIRRGLSIERHFNNRRPGGEGLDQAVPSQCSARSKPSLSRNRPNIHGGK
jgi:hypothetical protein